MGGVYVSSFSMWLQKLLQYGVLATLLLGTVYIWRMVPVPCKEPLEYTVGVFDSRFDLTQEVFLQEISAAEQLWEEALGKELFRYIPEASFRVNLVFDERQEQTIVGQKLEASLEKAKASQETLNQKQTRVLALYEKEGKEYERMLALFKRRLVAYNGEVAKWNKQGGAPKEEYQKLEAVSKTLSQEQKELEAKRQEVNTLATQVNAFSKEKVGVIEEYNTQVTSYTERYGKPQEFDQGEYVGEEINIYQYDDLFHLRAVLVHELGHALGLGHGSDPQSIMFHLMKDQPLNPLVLSNEDVAMLFGQCHQSTWDFMKSQLGPLKSQITLSKVF